MRAIDAMPCLIGAVLLLLSGCLNPFTTEFPTFQAKHPLVEKRAYEFHDPFPDDSAGPDTQNRPRGFEIQRAEPRRAVEGRLLLGIGPATGPALPQLPATQQQYPTVVRQ